MDLPSTAAEAKTKELKFYFTGRPCKHGHLSKRKASNRECYQCHRLAQKQRDQKYYINNREAYLAKGRINYENNKDRYKASARKQQESGYMREYLIEYYKNNKSYYKVHAAKRRAAILQRTPAWADFNKIKEIYLNCPKGYDVDHIIPLRGRLVSGFHIHTNLQYLTSKANRVKYNAFNPVKHKEELC